MGKGRYGVLRLKGARQERKRAYPIHHHVGTVMDSIVWHPESCWLRNSIAQIGPIQHKAMVLGGVE